MPKKMILTEAQKTALKTTYADGLSLRATAEVTGIPLKVVQSRIRRWGLSRTRSQAARKYALDENAFTDATSTALYWTGMLMADGNVMHTYGRQARVSLSLHRKDKKHVEKLAAFVGMPVTAVHDSKKRPVSKLTIHSNRMAQDLAKCGVVPNKSLIAQIPDGRSDILQSRDFWRGMIDGDGSIGIPKPSYCVLTLTSGSPIMLCQFESFLQRNRLPTGRIAQQISYVISGNRSIPIIRHLYAEAAPSLQRKAKLASEIMRWI